jgi:hypothetical protein
MSLALMWIVRVLVMLVVIRLVLRALGIGQRAPAPRPRAREVERAGGTLVQDPQCGTYLPKSRALTLGAGGDAKYFCSPGCRDAYAAAHRT